MHPHPARWHRWLLYSSVLVVLRNGASMPQALRKALNYGINYGMGYNRLCISQQAACQALTIDQGYFSVIRTNGRHGVVGDDHIQALTFDLVLRCCDQVLRLGSES